MQELTSHKKQGPGFLSRMGETVRAVAASVRGVKNRPEEFNTIQEYVEAFSQKMSSLDRITHRIVKEEKGEFNMATLWFGSTLNTQLEFGL